jgi:DNA-binding beta-propeller fold protein YncE
MHARTLPCFVLLIGLATACSSPPAATEATGATASLDLLQPAPGVDVDREKAVGQVVDAQGMLGWYPHEGGLMKYRVAIRFGQEPNTMPEGWTFGRVSAVATDSSNQVFVFHRGETADPLVVFDAEGNYVRSFGRGMFGNEHGLRIDRHDNVWITDNGDHQVMKFSNDGELLMTLGIKGEPGTTDDTFNRPADITFGPNDELYVADGYGNNRVVKFDAEGNFVATWGTPGSGPGEFDLVHSVAVDSQGQVYVSDRENNRIQIFDENGEFLRMWTHLGATQNIFITPDDQVWVITHRDNIENITYDTLAGRIMRIDIETGEILGAMESPGHWIDVAETGEIFIGSLTGNVFRWYQGPWQGMR